MDIPSRSYSGRNFVGEASFFVSLFVIFLKFSLQSYETLIQFSVYCIQKNIGGVIHEKGQ